MTEEKPKKNVLDMTQEERNKYADDLGDKCFAEFGAGPQVLREAENRRKFLALLDPDTREYAIKCFAELGLTQ